MLKQHTIFFDSCVSPQKPFGLRGYARPMECGDISLRYINGIGPYDSKEITKNADKICKWKIITSHCTNEHAGQADKSGRKKLLSTTEVLTPGQICTETYLVLNFLDSEYEAISNFKYVKTLFARFLLALSTAAQSLSKSNFRFVPLQDFTENSDIDWSDSIEGIDRQLYKKYGLTKEEIDFIESMIKPME